MTQHIPETTPEFDRTRVIERPDGFYWQAKDNGREYGPFATLLEAVQSMQAGDGAPEPGETLAEAEAESASPISSIPTPASPPRKAGRGSRSTDAQEEKARAGARCPAAAARAERSKPGAARAGRGKAPVPAAQERYLGRGPAQGLA
jgi:hypothetical protein